MSVPATEPRSLLPWDRAADRIAAEFSDGELISMAWLETALEIHKPDILKLERMPPETWRESVETMFQKHQFDWLQAMDKLRSSLLDRYQIALANVRGKGYVRLPPGQQTEHALGLYIRDISAAWRKTNHLLVNIRFTELNQEERKANLEARAKMEHIRNSNAERHRKLLPKKPTEDD